ncbi:unnamed protein product (macronuclear) [Paramecium tetraurelia]|uniref:Uncharacterized protein n=1 Tax=Paramecium tetraurelia TaxID=5888 RepID=A0C3F2_PARTE|nr:uncharacterized protein GSPATT00034798001 [Paramecium tetraurelia]CAK65319.1 unnamed protein product [Paramecium tetraurelia]|eukprot:XP_001432716.1 hypothetical protein (macronuclear) [Paramecium tetraurelia strain d4-2]
MQLLKLNQFQPLSKVDKPIPGNVVICLQLGPNYVTFKSFALKYSEDCQHYYINFLLNYYEAFQTKDNSYHLEFQMCYFELLPQFDRIKNIPIQRGYKLKNLKENFNIKPIIDQVIAITSYKDMKCYILDPQTHPQSRFNDHEIVTRTILHYFQQTFSVECCLLKEIKQDATALIRSALLLDFIYKYMDESNNVERIENIKIRSSDAKQLLEKIKWFIQKCYNDNIYITNQQRQQPKLMDKLLSYDEWKQQMNSDSFEKVNKIKDQFKSRNESIIKFNQPTSPDSSISILSLMGQNQLNQSLSSSQSGISMNAQSFLKQQIYNQEIPRRDHRVNEDVITKQEFENLLRDAKQQIRQEVLEELKREQDEKMQQYETKLQTKYNPLDEQIAQEYLTQVKFQRYKEYLDYLMEYYYNNDKQEYYKLIDEYNQRLKDTALNGMVEVQKQEILKLQAITKKKIVEQNQQLEIALYNQKKELKDIIPIKNKLQERKEDYQRFQIQQNKHEYKFQFANVNLTIDPFEFKTDQQVDEIRKQKTILDQLDLSKTEIKEMQNAWKFETSKSSLSRSSVYNYDEELEKLQKLYQNKNIPEPYQSNRYSNNVISHGSNPQVQSQAYSNLVFSNKDPTSQRNLKNNDPTSNQQSKYDLTSKQQSKFDPMSKRNLDLSNAQSEFSRLQIGQSQKNLDRSIRQPSQFDSLSQIEQNQDQQK